MKNEMERLLAERDALAAEIAGLVKIAGEHGIAPYNTKFAQPEYLELVKTPVGRLNDVLAEIFRHELEQNGPAHFSKENVWVWGGPTPSWGGSMAKDTSLKAAAYFGFENVMYVYGALTRETVGLHRNCGKLICHLGANCRTDGAQVGSDLEEAENLSRLSLEFPNVRGGVLDDMLGNYGTNYSRKDYAAIHEALKKHNPALELYCVVYTHELDSPEAGLLADCIDRVILWTWCRQNLAELDLNVEKCRARFPGKPIMMGVFMFDYGLTALPNDVPTLSFQLSRARKYLSEGKIQDIVILGDREIEKCPAAAKFIRNFFQQEFESPDDACAQVSH